MKQQILVLKVIYEDDSTMNGALISAPADWQWDELTGDSIEVLAAGPITQITPIEAEVRRRLRG